MSEAAQQPSPPPEEPFPDIFQVLNDDDDFDIQDSDGQSLDALDQDQPALEGATDLEDVLDQLDELDGAAEEAEPPIFIVNVGTDGSWTEQVPVNGTLVNAGTTGDCRTFSATDTGSGAALIQLGAGQAVVLQKDDVGSAGGFTRFIQIGPAATSLAKLNLGVTATNGVCDWTYGMTLITGGTISAFDPMEHGGAMIGAPGSMGITITSDGTDGKTSGGCIICPHGTNNNYVPVYQVAGSWFVSGLEHGTR